MKERPILFSGEMVRAILAGRKTQTRRVCKSGFDCGAGEFYAVGDCPYGSPGDRLWVKETFCEIPLKSGKMGFAYRADGSEAFEEIEDGYEWMGKWKPFIFMPRKASRITLEIVAVRVERLNEISKYDAEAEGIPMDIETIRRHNYKPASAYKELWESINGKGSWDKNPWVWVIEFKKL